MLSIVLPLMVCAIALTPVVASARTAYKHELDQLNHAGHLGESCVKHFSE